jgi:hypothetical protein
MTPDQVFAIATPIAVIIAAITQQLSTHRVAKKVDDNATKVTETAKILADKTAIENQTVATKLNEIHILVDGKLAAALLKMSDLRAEIAAAMPHDERAQKEAADARREYEEQRARLNEAAGIINTDIDT